MKNFLVFLFFFILMTPLSFGAQYIKEPNVSGQFYSADPRKLAQDIAAFFSSASVNPFDKKVEVLISPHAGYAYSGGVAAYSFKAVSKAHYNTIVVLGPSHFFDFVGISVWNKGGFTTPLGVVAVDEDFSNQLMALNENFRFKPEVFEREHSLEVELPFLQQTFQNFKIVPILMGRPDLKVCQDLALALDQLIGKREDVLIVVSSDMSHYHSDVFARVMDHVTLEAIKAVRVDHLWTQSLSGQMEMCGFVPVTTALLYAKKRGLNHVDILKYANSGDVTGDKDRVVGYGAVVFYKEGSEAHSMAVLGIEQKKRLIHIAKETIKAYVEEGKTLAWSESDQRLSVEEGAFVTIHKSGRLRGCIGNILGKGPLYQTVGDMVIAAATRDPRFTPVRKEELNDIEVEISVLSKPRRVRDAGEIEMGVHGVIVSRGLNHGVFLPQVATETGWNKEKFLSELCSQKAGLPADCWKDPDTTLEIFTANVFGEKDVGP